MSPIPRQKLKGGVKNEFIKDEHNLIFLDIIDQ